MIRFLHVSDLHIGDVPWWVGSFAPYQGPPRKPTRYPTNRGHDERVAEGLSSFWKILKRHAATNGDVARVIATGDITRQGHGDEFGCARRLLHAEWTAQGPVVVPGSRLFGLGAGHHDGEPELLAIPGNHDYWSGVMMNPVVARSRTRSHFWPLPWTCRVIDQKAPMELHVVGLDTMSGLGHFSPSQFLAKGAIAPRHLDEAADSLAKAASDARLRARILPGLGILRVAAIHHPVHDLANADEFAQWSLDNGIAAILCGHTHEADSRRPPRSAALQLTCGATTQAGTRTRLPSLEENHMFVHLVEWVDAQGLGMVQWHSQWWRHDGLRWYFEKMDPGPSSPLLTLAPP